MHINKVELLTRNLSRIAAFYQQVLELPVIQQADDYIAFKAGASILSFRQSNNHQGFYHFAFLVPANKIEEAYKWVSERVAILPFDDSGDMANFANWNAHAFYFHDRDKNIVEYIAHHDLQNNIDTPFSLSAVERICEIGIVVDDVTDWCAKVHNSYGVPYFSKGPVLPHFAAMGDSEGLFIVSQWGRGWLPTDKPAVKAAVEVAFAIDDRQYQIKDDGQ